jgi:hypothetical protein
MDSMFNVWTMMNNQNEKMHFDDNEKEIVDGWSTYTEMMP